MEIDGKTLEYIIKCTNDIILDWNQLLDPVLLMQSKAEPNETPLWEALMVEHLLLGHTSPWESFMIKFKGLQVNEEGIITNREEYFGKIKENKN